MKKRVIPALLCLLLLAGCTPAAEQPMPTPSDETPAPSPTQTAEVSPTEIGFAGFVREVNDERKNRIAWTDAEWESGPEFTLTFPGWQKTAWTDEEVKALCVDDRPTASVTLAEAQEDVRTFFQILQTTYGAYDYFGGDEVFLPLKEKALEALKEYDAWDNGVLEDVLAQLLAPILRDGHMSIGATAMRDRYMEYMYYVPDIYLDDISGLDASYIKPTIGSDGAITHCFAAMSHDGSDLPTSLGGYDLVWVQAEEQSNGDLAYNPTVVEGVAVMQCYSMMDVGGNKSRLGWMADSGEEWREHSTFIMDIRGNFGGDDSYAMQWFKGFTGQFPQRKAAIYDKGSQLMLEVGVRDWGWSRSGAEKMLGGWRGSEVDGIWAENDTTVFILTDKGVASSGESMVEIMRTADNAVFVGGPTMGCALVKNQISLCLPYTGLGIYLGTGLSLCETLQNTDGAGYLPDLWVNPPDAQDAVLRLIEYYGLARELQ